jgi:hypothetical protein
MKESARLQHCLLDWDKRADSIKRKERQDCDRACRIIRFEFAFGEKSKFPQKRIV